MPHPKPPAPPAKSAGRTSSSHEDGDVTDLGEMMLNFDILKAVIALEPSLITTYSEALFPDWYKKASGPSVKGSSRRRNTLKASSEAAGKASSKAPGKASSKTPGIVKRVRFADEEPSASTHAGK